MRDYITCANNDNKTDDYNDFCVYTFYTHAGHCAKPRWSSLQPDLEKESCTPI